MSCVCQNVHAKHDKKKRIKNTLHNALYISAKLNVSHIVTSYFLPYLLNNFKSYHRIAIILY